MSLQYSVHAGPFEAGFVEALGKLGAAVFGAPKDDLAWRLAHMPMASVVCASEAGDLVGFKAGYATGRTRYYSWLGGVRADFRRRGIAGELLRHQHAWLYERGFIAVETATNRDNLAMTQANLRHGFAVCGLKHKSDRVQILFSKELR
ncbi:GNAT family N-acetyltransferase [Dokdonella sp.]|uniref:GNAT family N-acetyltransferase n=1 Tax=Dokdonella sp. TaxID=2291710 RepID=UPI001B182077|nr:GNAT family N-acetyltransferase [Dokdonella sp.]MBO9664731.1 GNAT family N-acetyltransferase [Dokdonella sp.]